MNPDELIPPELRKSSEKQTHDEAVNLIRHKLDAIYSHEPNAKKQANEVKEMTAYKEPLSKHQRYMKRLNDSGKDTAEIQTAWHEYYQKLNDEEKREVWQEFYAQQAHKKQHHHPEKANELDEKPAIHVSHNTQQNQSETHITNPNRPHTPRRKGSKRVFEQKTLPNPRNRPGKLAKIKQNHHVKSLAFGLSMGFVVVFILLLSFFNERFIVPFIRPSGTVSATPIIIDPNSSGPVGPEPKIIIPKINLEVPVIYDVPSIEEKDVQAGLEKGVVHYITTPNPGETGNTVIFGHSSGNILNKGKYKFAFILLKSLEKDDNIIVQKDGKRYVYKVYDKHVTDPTDFSVLKPDPQRSSILTLITCDPPGTSKHRLIVIAEQIFPDPKTNIKSSLSDTSFVKSDKLPSNSPSLWQRLFN